MSDNLILGITKIGDLLVNLFTDSGKLTKAGYLLFAKDTEKRVIGSFIKIGFFEGAEIIYQDEVKGPLLEQAQKTVDIIFTKYLKAAISYQGVTRVETFPFAYAAIREAVYNAIVHRAYNCMNLGTRHRKNVRRMQRKRQSAAGI